MKKILLFADIGGHEYQQYYHVGDEAMWNETYRWYKKNHPQWQISTFSWLATHANFKLAEYSHLHWPTQHSKRYFPLLIGKYLLWYSLRLNYFSRTEFLYVRAIETHDRLHFTGGGNLSSQFRPWMYSCFFTIFVAALSRREVLLTSQTLGPFTGIDQVVAAFILNLPALIAIRARTSPMAAFKQFGIFWPKTRWMLDAAYTPTETASEYNHAQKNITLGLSVHAWPGYQTRVTKHVRKLLIKLAKSHNVTVVLLPHHLSSDGTNNDTHTMERILQNIPEAISVVHAHSAYIASAQNTLADHIRTETGQLDVLITSRYHGIIFALSQNVPVLALNFDAYYQLKNQGALEAIFPTHAQLYQISLNSSVNPEVLFEKIWYILKNRKKIARALRQKNTELSNTLPTLTSVMSEFELSHKKQ